MMKKESSLKKILSFNFFDFFRMVATALTQNLYLGKWRQPYQLPPLEKGVQTLSIER